MIENETISYNYPYVQLLRPTNALRKELICLLARHFEGDNTDGLIQAVKKLEEFINA